MLDLTSPNAVPIINLVGYGILGVLAAFGIWWGKRKPPAPTTPKEELEALSKTQVAVPMMALADTATLKELVQGLRDKTDVDRKTLWQLERLNDQVEEIKHTIERRNSRHGMTGPV